MIWGFLCVSLFLTGCPPSFTAIYAERRQWLCIFSAFPINKAFLLAGSEDEAICK